MMRSKKLYRYFDEINNKMFGGSLPPCKLVLSNLITADCGSNKILIQEDGSIQSQTITIFLHYHRNDKEILSTLIHEMVHSFVALVLGSNLFKSSDLFLEHDIEIFNSFGEIAFLYGYIKTPDLFGNDYLFLLE